jgi:Flp pilus assembly pilin Flp
MKYIFVIQHFLRKGNEGVTSIEYAFIASLIAVVISTIVGQIGDQVLAFFQSVVKSFP